MTPSGHNTPVRVLAGVARVGLGVIFLLSGFSKLYSPLAAQNLMLYVTPIPGFMVPAAVTVLSVVECIMGGMLCINRMVLTTSIVLGAFLMGAIPVGVLFLATPVPCGCFGDLIESRTDHWFLLRNFVLFGLVAFVLSQAKAKRGGAAT